MASGSAHGMRRVFVALAPPPELARAACAATAAALAERAASDPLSERAPGRAPAGWKVASPAHVHVTLAFLGEVPEKLLPDLDRAVAETAARSAAPRLRVRGTGAFPDRAQPRVLWVGVGEEPGSEGRLAELQADVAEALRRARLRFDDRAGTFVPHLTVARPARARRSARAQPPLPDAFGRLALDLAWAPDAVLCIESRLGAPSAERYPVLSRHPLAL